MRRNSGLYTEIILTMALVVSAALIFGGFLLLRLTERELLAQKVESSRQLIAYVARTLSSAEASPKAPPGFSLFEPVLNEIGPDLQSWQIYDRYANMVAGRRSDDQVLNGIAKQLVQKVNMLAEPVSRVDYHYNWLPVASGGGGSVTIAAPLKGGGRGHGVLLARISLETIGRQIASARNLVLLYVFLYGAVLVAFGVVLLGRNVIKPVRRLREATSQVAAGDLGTNVPVVGPGEISDLAVAFNAMTKALQTGREELVRSERMASVGHLSAGMAHEIGNPLGAVLGYLELLKSELEPGRNREMVEHSLQEVERIDRLVKELLDYAAPTGAILGIVDPVDVLREAVAIVSHQKVFAEIEFDIDCPAKLGLVRIDSHKLMQVLVNLMVNAKDCMELNNRIHVKAIRQGEFAEIAVRDEGCGIPEELLPHIFDPFFTKKPQGKGRGLGLTICHRIITEAGGKIFARSREGVGTTFTLLLPVERDQ